MIEIIGLDYGLCTVYNKNMLHIDLKYISLVGPNLRNFKKKKTCLFNCSCPICGDSEKKKTKARGFFYQKGQSMYYKCHNCSAGMGVGNFLKSVFPSYYDEFLLEKYKSGVTNKKTEHAITKLSEVKFYTLTSKHATKISELPDEHFAKQYVLNRKIPTPQHSKLFYTEDFAALVDDVFPGKYTNLKQNDVRLVIPFFDSNENVIGLQGRSLFADGGLRYITIRASSTTDLIYGLERLDKSRRVFVVEGPIDSLFLPNCIAAANSDLCSCLNKLGLCPDAVLMFDNEPRNKEIVSLMSEAIKQNKKICIWPNTVLEKDINEMILAGTSTEDLLNIIDNRTFSGLNAELELSQWKKI